MAKRNYFGYASPGEIVEIRRLFVTGETILGLCLAEGEFADTLRVLQLNGPDAGEIWSFFLNDLRVLNDAC